ncbi:hypothetical protein [uncultured Winogradskyella sp.]|uniref:hypothetical protein n=1 Tax=uncultured Winogradskyella sp. TaxID=395353 RepID=UPI00260ED3E2|nr:hypothetical protein [uncultured Winogradskyella sp.]
MAKEKDTKKELLKEELFEVIPLIDVGCFKSGKPKHPKGKPSKVNAEKRDNWKLNNIIK